MDPVLKPSTGGIAVKLCPQCNNSPWPFFMVAFIAGLVAFLTWLILSFAGANTAQGLVGTGIAFLAVGSTLLHYVLSCMKRHCRHQRAHSAPGYHHDHGHGAAH